METTLVLLKPGCVHRQLIGEVINRFERRGLRISGMKMMQLSDEILREHYAHLVDKPFFPSLQASMQGGSRAMRSTVAGSSIGVPEST